MKIRFVAAVSAPHSVGMTHLMRWLSDTNGSSKSGMIEELTKVGC